MEKNIGLKKVNLREITWISHINFNHRSFSPIIFFSFSFRLIPLSITYFRLYFVESLVMVDRLQRV